MRGNSNIGRAVRCSAKARLFQNRDSIFPQIFLCPPSSPTPRRLAAQRRTFAIRWLLHIHRWRRLTSDQNPLSIPRWLTEDDKSLPHRGRSSTNSRARYIFCKPPRFPFFSPTAPPPNRHKNTPSYLKIFLCRSAHIYIGDKELNRDCRHSPQILSATE